MILIPVQSNAIVVPQLWFQGLNRVLAMCVVEPTKEVIMYYLNTVNLFGMLHVLCFMMPLVCNHLKST